MRIGLNRVPALDKVHPEEKISGSGGPRHLTMLNFVQIGPSIVEILQFFSRWRPSAILELFGAYLDHSQKVLSGLCHCAKFDYDDAIVLII